MRNALLAAFAGRKALALVAGGLVLGVGAGATTLAAWVDQESVWGGTGDTGTTPGGPGGGLSSSLFNMQQSANGTDYVDAPTSGAQLSFSAAAANLSPGTTTYAYVYLRTVVRSAGGDVSLRGATTTGDAPLAAALTYSARVGGTQAQCASSTFSSSGTELVPPGSPLPTPAASTFALAAATSSSPGAAKGVCFAVTLPDTATSAVSGQQVTPTWTFRALSN